MLNIYLVKDRKMSKSKLLQSFKMTKFLISYYIIFIILLYFLANLLNLNFPCTKGG